MLGFAVVETTHSFAVMKSLVEGSDTMLGDCLWELAFLSMACCEETDVLSAHSSFSSLVLHFGRRYSERNSHTWHSSTLFGADVQFR